MGGAGKLRHRVKLKELTKTTSDRGGVVEKWVTTGTVWASVKQMSASEKADGPQLVDTGMYEVVIRYRDDVTEKHRFEFRGLELEIAGPPDNVGFKDRYLKCRCRVTS